MAFTDQSEIKKSKGVVNIILKYIG